MNQSFINGFVDELMKIAKDGNDRGVRGLDKLSSCRPARHSLLKRKSRKIRSR